MFGPNASLDVQGSFTASTADEVTFPDGGSFSASDPGSSILSVAPPEAFGFLGPSGALTIDAMPNLRGMLNVGFFVESDSDRRSSLYIDSVLVSGEWD